MFAYPHARHLKVCCLAAAACGLLVSLNTRADLDVRWVFLSSLLFFGLAHGACDLWLPGWIRRQAMGGKFVSLFALGYLGLAGLVLVFWRWQPGLAAGGFLLLTAWHWGSADAALTDSRSWRFTLLAWGRGLMVIAAPAAFHPDSTSRVLNALDSSVLGGMPPAHLRTLAGCVLVASLGMQSLALPLRSSRGARSGTTWKPSSCWRFLPLWMR